MFQRKFRGVLGALFLSELWKMLLADLSEAAHQRPGLGGAFCLSSGRCGLEISLKQLTKDLLGAASLSRECASLLLLLLLCLKL